MRNKLFIPLLCLMGSSLLFSCRKTLSVNDEPAAATHEISGSKALSALLISSQPVAVSRDANHLSVFALNSSNNLLHRSWSNTDGWTDWEIIGSNIASIPAVLSQRPSSISVFAQGTNNNLMYITWSDTRGWSAWENLGGNLVSGPVVVARDASSTDVFARGPNNTLIRKQWIPRVGWAAWENIPMNLTTKPSVVSNSSGNIHVFGTTGSFPGYATHIAWNVNTGWGPLDHLNGPTNDEVSAVSPHAGQLDVFIWQSGGLLSKFSWTDRIGWASKWDTISRVSYGVPVAIARDMNNISVFVSGNDRRLWVYNRTSSGGWAPPINLSRDISSKIAVISPTPDQFKVFATSSLGALQTISWTSTTGWSTWTTL